MNERGIWSPRVRVPIVLAVWSLAAVAVSGGLWFVGVLICA